MPPKTIYLREEDVEWIENRTDETGESRSAVVKKALDALREREGDDE